MQPYGYKCGIKNDHVQTTVFISIDQGYGNQRCMGICQQSDRFHSQFFHHIANQALGLDRKHFGKNLADLNVRERFHINIIGIKQGENVTVDLDPSEPLPDNCSIIAIGKNKDLNASREELR